MKNIALFKTAFVLCLLASLTFTACSDDDDTEELGEPAVYVFFPEEGLPSTEITIVGRNFGNSQSTYASCVYFGDVAATEYTSWSNKEITVVVPEGGESGYLTVWIGSNSAQSVTEFTCVAGATFSKFSSSSVSAGDQITIYCDGLDYFVDYGISASDIIVTFTTATGTTSVSADAFDANGITVTVPTEAVTGEVTVALSSLQTFSAGTITVDGDVTIITLNEYVEYDGDNLTIASSSISSTQDGDWVIYKITPSMSGLFDVYTSTATTADGNALHVNIGKNLDLLKRKTLDDTLVKDMENQGSYSKRSIQTFGAFELEEGEEYYLKVTFLTPNNYGGNLFSLYYSPSDDQTQTAVNTDEDEDVDYVLYENDFNSTSYLYPFSKSPCYDPNYINVENGYAEFYYNAAALAANNSRNYRGCEVVCDFSTNSEGWYGFQIYLPGDGSFPMDEGGIIIAQVFNSGCRNSWAGHLRSNEGTLELLYRAALVDPNVVEVGELETDKWIPIVLYFKAGYNSKGRLKVWMGDDMDEDNPTVDTGDCDFGFGHWLDEEHLDNTGTNTECASYSSYGGSDSLGPKFGLYVSNTVDITIRYDDIKALEGNPDGAFSIVCPN